jgi:hypothetical protein
MKIAKRIIFLSLAALALYSSIDAGINYLSYEQTLHEGGYTYHSADFKTMSDYEKLSQHMFNSDYDIMSGFDKTFRLLMILFFMAFCIFLYLGVFAENGKEEIKNLTLISKEK